MSDRVRDSSILGLVVSLLIALPALSPSGARIELALAALLFLSLLTLLRGPAPPGLVPRVLFALAVLFLALQPFRMTPDVERVPLQAMAMLAVAIALWAQMNVQSVSGKLVWSFSPFDFAVLSACGLTLFGSLGVLWWHADTRQMTPHLLLQGAAVETAVLYLYLTRWRPDRLAFLAAVFALAAVLTIGLLRR